MKEKELISNIDSLMEYSSLISCLGEISDFAVERLNFYHEKNKDKGTIDLLEILSSDENKREEIRDVYMERHYQSFCSYLQDRLTAAREELEKLGPKLGFGEENSVQNHKKRVLKCLIPHSYILFNLIKKQKIRCLRLVWGELDAYYRLSAYTHDRLPF